MLPQEYTVTVSAYTLTVLYAEIVLTCAENRLIVLAQQKIC